MRLASLASLLAMSLFIGFASPVMATDGNDCTGRPDGEGCLFGTGSGPWECRGGLCVSKGSNVPEMSTYVAGALLMAGAGFILYRRRQLKIG